MTSYQYQPLGTSSLRLLRYLPHCTPDDIHLGIEHHIIENWNDTTLATASKAAARREIEASAPYGNTTLLTRLRLAEQHGIPAEEFFRRGEIISPPTAEHPQAPVNGLLQRGKAFGKQVVTDFRKKASNSAPAKKFIALSYTWGDATTRRDITLNGNRFSVTLNLWLALSGILKHHHTSEIQYYWIDAICINQSDISEKEQQVRQMYKIYFLASQVFAWVDSEDTHLDPAWGRPQFDLFRETYNNRRFGGTGQNIASYPYFTRTWVQSEVLQGVKVLFLFGSSKIDSMDLHLIFKNAKADHLPGGKLLLRRFQGRSYGFQSLLSHYGSTECGNRLDMIFAMHADPTWQELGDPEELKVDYGVDIKILAVRVLSYLDRVETADRFLANMDVASIIRNFTRNSRNDILDIRYGRSMGGDEPSVFAGKLLPLLSDRRCLQTDRLRFENGDSFEVKGLRLKELQQLLKESGER